jgi:hypothetical protein
MSVIGSLNAGVAGIQKGMADAQRHANKLASADSMTAADPASMTEAFVGLKEAELQVKASAEVVKTTEEMIGALLDEYA